MRIDTDFHVAYRGLEIRMKALAEAGGDVFLPVAEPEDVLQLVIASGYLSKLTRNSGIKRYLSQHHPEILTEFQAIISATSLDQASTP